MSRNLKRTNCFFCRGAVKLEEAPRLIKEADCGEAYPEHKGMTVARARCSACEAKYLAWVVPVIKPPNWQPWRTADGFYDLSFRKKFSDEPDVADLPVFEITTIRVRVPWPHLCGNGHKALHTRCLECNAPVPPQQAKKPGALAVAEDVLNEADLLVDEADDGSSGRMS
jgi:hypothetical protein